MVGKTVSTSGIFTGRRSVSLTVEAIGLQRGVRRRRCVGRRRNGGGRCRSNVGRSVHSAHAEMAQVPALRHFHGCVAAHGVRGNERVEEAEMGG